MRLLITFPFAVCRAFHLPHLAFALSARLLINENGFEVLNYFNFHLIFAADEHPPKHNFMISGGAFRTFQWKERKTLSSSPARSFPRFSISKAFNEARREFP